MFFDDWKYVGSYGIKKRHSIGFKNNKQTCMSQLNEYENMYIYIYHICMCF